MDSVNSEWDEFKRSLSGIKKANSIREQLNVLSAQLNEIEQDTKVLPELKEELEGEEMQAENEQALQAEQPDPMAMMGGMMGGGVPPGAEGGEPMAKSDIGGMPTEPTADAINATDGDDKVMALFDQLIAALSEAAHQALDAGDIGKLMKLSNVQGNINALQQDIAPLSASVPVNELGGGEPIAKAERITSKKPSSAEPIFASGEYYTYPAESDVTNYYKALENALEMLSSNILPSKSIWDRQVSNQLKEHNLRRDYSAIEEAEKNGTENDTAGSEVYALPSILRGVYGQNLDISSSMKNLYDKAMELQMRTPAYANLSPESQANLKSRVIRDVNSAIQEIFGRILEGKSPRGIQHSTEYLGQKERDPVLRHLQTDDDDTKFKDAAYRQYDASKPGKVLDFGEPDYRSWEAQLEAVPKGDEEKMSEDEKALLHAVLESSKVSDRAYLDPKYAATLTLSDAINQENISNQKLNEAIQRVEAARKARAEEKRKAKAKEKAADSGKLFYDENGEEDSDQDEVEDVDDWESEPYTEEELEEIRPVLFRYSPELINRVSREYNDQVDYERAKYLGPDNKDDRSPAGTYKLLSNMFNTGTAQRVVPLSTEFTPRAIGDFMRKAAPDSLAFLRDVKNGLGLPEDEQFDNYNYGARATVDQLKGVLAKIDEIQHGKVIDAESGLREGGIDSINPKIVEQERRAEADRPRQAEKVMGRIRDKLLMLALSDADLTGLSTPNNKFYDPVERKLVWSNHESLMPELNDFYSTAKLFADSAKTNPENQARRDKILAKLAETYGEFDPANPSEFYSNLLNDRSAYNQLVKEESEYRKHKRTHDDLYKNLQIAQSQKNQVLAQLPAKIHNLLPEGYENMPSDELIGAIDTIVNKTLADKNGQNYFDQIDYNLANLYENRGYIKDSLTGEGKQWDLNADDFGNKLLAAQHLTPKDEAYRERWKESIPATSALNRLYQWYHQMNDIAWAFARAHKDDSDEDLYQTDDKGEVLFDEKTGIPLINPARKTGFDNTYRDLVTKVFKGDKVRTTYLKLGHDLGIPAAQVVSIMPMLDSQFGSNAVLDSGALNPTIVKDLVRTLKFSTYPNRIKKKLKRSRDPSVITWTSYNLGESPEDILDLSTTVNPEKYLEVEKDKEGKELPPTVKPLQDVAEYAKGITTRQMEDKGMWNAGPRIDAIMAAKKQYNDLKNAAGPEEIIAVPPIADESVLKKYLYATKSERLLKEFANMYDFLYPKVRRKDTKSRYMDKFNVHVDGDETTDNLPMSKEDFERLNGYMNYFKTYMDARLAYEKPRGYNGRKSTKDQYEDEIRNLADSMYKDLDEDAPSHFVGYSERGEVNNILSHIFKDLPKDGDLKQAIEQAKYKDTSFSEIAPLVYAWGLMNKHAKRIPGYEVTGRGPTRVETWPRLSINTKGSNSPLEWDYSIVGKKIKGENSSLKWGQSFRGDVRKLPSADKEKIRNAIEDKIMYTLTNSNDGLPFDLGKIADEYRREQQEEHKNKNKSGGESKDKTLRAKAKEPSKDSGIADANDAEAEVLSAAKAGGKQAVNAANKHKDTFTGKKDKEETKDE